MVSQQDRCSSLLTTVSDSTLPRYCFLSAQIMTSYRCKLQIGSSENFFYGSLFVLGQSCVPCETLSLMRPRTSLSLQFGPFLPLWSNLQPHWASCYTLNIPDNSSFIGAFTLTCPFFYPKYLYIYFKVFTHKSAFQANLLWLRLNCNYNSSSNPPKS